MTLQEKLDYIGGVNNMYIRNIARLGLPLIKMSDGPVGVRTWGQTTAYPAGILSASTWDVDLIYQLGTALGKDARARGVHILLGPGLNIYRAPMCGRNFEYFGEDPFLSGQMAANFINGVQSQRVVATAKHFAGNNQEWDRMNVSSDIDERTMQEIYLPAFRAAVMIGKAGAVMNSYNLLNGIHATQNTHLNNEILKGQWGFNGILMSDWGATHDGLAAAKGGLDLEMPQADYMNSSTLMSYISGGTLAESIIDDKVRRILRVIFSFGFYDKNQTDNTIPLNNPANIALSQKIAENGIVLLKNQDSILPLSLIKIKSIALIGPNVNQYITGGGSSYTSPFTYTTIYQGFKNILDTSVTINLADGIQNTSKLAARSVFFTDSTLTVKGLTGFYFKNQTLTNPPDYSRIDTVIDFHWTGVPNVPGFPADNFSIRWTGVIKPQQTGVFNFVARVDDGCRLWINNKLIINQWHDQAAAIYQDTITLKADSLYPLKLEYYENAGSAEITFGWQKSDAIFKDAIDAATGTDAAIVCVGFNSSTEGEGFDRTFELPAMQDSLINAVASANPNTIVIVNAGGNVFMEKWLKNVKGLLYAWYPGQEGGTAIAEILFGKINPSGKLPVSFEKKWADNPAFNNYYTNNGPNRVKYNEGIFLGYRYYTSTSIEPMFPFGFGMSYTTFEYSNLNLVKDTAGGSVKCTVTFDIKNTGNVAGAEAAQVYVRDIVSSVSRPVRELKGFTKIALTPGQKKPVSVVLNCAAFAFFSTDSNKFKIEKGDFEIQVGASSEDIRLKGTITIDNDYFFNENIEKVTSNEGFDIYPVPASKFLLFRNNLPGSKNCNVEVIDLNGKLVERFNFSTVMYSYNCSSLANGYYLFRITTDKDVFTKKIVIEK